MAEAAPKFALFVVAVTGALVRQFGTGLDIGAKRSSEDEIKAGAPPIVWDEDAVTPITEAEYATYRKEYDRALRAGTLKRVDEAAFQGWIDLQHKRAEEAEAARLAALEKAEAEAKAADAQDEADGQAEQEREVVQVSIRVPMFGGGSAPPSKDETPKGNEES